MCQLINPAKSKIEKISKSIIKINKFIAARKIEISAMEEH